MSIYDKAKALADEIQNCDELRRVKESELKMLIDMEARQIVETYQQIQMDAICETIERNLESMQREAQCGELAHEGPPQALT